MRMYSAGEAQPWESASSFLASSRHQLASAQNAAKFPFLISSHVLRHSCGYKLANDGQDTRGDPALPRSPLDSLDRALHEAGTGSVQRVGKTEAAPVMVRRMKKGRSEEKG
jgi:hypothetical protein